MSDVSLLRRAVSDVSLLRRAVYSPCATIPWNIIRILVSCPMPAKPFIYAIFPIMFPDRGTFHGLQLPKAQQPMTLLWLTPSLAFPLGAAAPCCWVYRAPAEGHARRPVPALQGAVGAEEQRRRRGLRCFDELTHRGASQRCAQERQATTPQPSPIYLSSVHAAGP